MGDYSPHVLERARENVKGHGDHTSSLVLDARVPMQTLGFLRGKAFFINISNVYDNLPTDEVVRIGGHMYQVEVRAYIAEEAATTIAADLGVGPEELPDLCRLPSGDTLELRLQRDGREYDFKIAARKTSVKDVRTEYLGQGVGYLRLTIFDLSLVKEVRAALEDLTRRGMKGLILDLRQGYFPAPDCRRPGATPPLWLWR